MKVIKCNRKAKGGEVYIACWAGCWFSCWASREVKKP